MSWNYRILTEEVKGVRRYWIGEAYYNKAGEYDGGYSESYEHLLSDDSVDGLKDTLAQIQEAFDKPVLEAHREKQ